MISANQLKLTATFLNVETPCIAAVAEVESGGSGFLNGKPIILFEPHQFWRELKKRGIDPTKHTKGNEDVLYEKWGTKPYAKGQLAQHALLDKAAKINRDAALCSASWGKFQIMGYHYKACGCATLQEFINAMYESEDKHLELFGHFIKTNGYDKHLRAKDWATFARLYNGASYKVNKYDQKLANAYAKHK